MEYRDVLALCHFYKGEIIVPEELSFKVEGKLWTAEKTICMDLLSEFDKTTDARKTFDGLVASLIGKWAPYNLEQCLERYFKEDDTNKEAIYKAYL